MLGLPLSNNDQLKIKFSNLSLSASKLLDFHPRSSFFLVMRKRHAHIADGMKYHSNWYRHRIMGYCRKNKCQNDDIITITTTWSPKIALVLGNYIVNQVGNLCRGHPDKRIPHFEASCSCVQKKSSCKEEICKWLHFYAFLRNFGIFPGIFRRGFTTTLDSTTLTFNWLIFVGFDFSTSDVAIMNCRGGKWG